MNWTIDVDLHTACTAEARRRVSAAACGMGKEKTTPLLAELDRLHGLAVVLHAAVALCKTQPPGPSGWLRTACKTTSRKDLT